MHEWQGRKEVTPLISVTDSRGSYDYLPSGTISPSEDRRSAIEAIEIMTARRQERRERERVPRVKSP